MSKKLNCVLLVDDDSDCNFFHQRLLKKMKCVEQIYIVNDGVEALNYLKSNIDKKSPQPDIIFLDINMPRMNGWEFLDEYKNLDNEIKATIVLVMLTTSLNPDDKERAKHYSDVRGFSNKYLDEASLKKIINEHFPDCL
jgi:CheY-like chemotaxis protein